ncbi:uncharacterized protein LOC144102299 [Amblyomma americanum]
MHSLRSLEWVGLGVFLLAVHLAGAEKVHGAADAFHVFESFPFALAIFDADLDGDLDCVSAKRTQYDKDARTATYVWMLKGNSPKNVTYHIKRGPTFDTSTYTIDDDYEHEYNAHFYFSDYKSCVIFGMPYKDREECTLFVSRDVKDNVPKICEEKFVENCDLKVIAYDKDTCGDFLDVD